VNIPKDVYGVVDDVAVESIAVDTFSTQLI
jgi:hypothetical protein